MKTAQIAEEKKPPRKNLGVEAGKLKDGRVRRNGLVNQTENRGSKGTDETSFEEHAKILEDKSEKWKKKV